MIPEFVDFVSSLFPNVDPTIKNNARKAIEQFVVNGEKNQFLLDSPLDYLAQGDIFEDVPFIYSDKDGNFKGYKTKGFLISYTCDCENDEVLTFAPMFELSRFKSATKGNFKNNYVYSQLYFPDERIQDFVVDFSKITHIRKDILEERIERKQTKKLFSLNLLGFYLLVAKLTIHFLRAEDQKTQNDRKQARLEQGIS